MLTIFHLKAIYLTYFKIPIDNNNYIKINEVIKCLVVRIKIRVKT